MVVEVGIARVLRQHTSAVNSLDFSKDGELLLSSGDDQRVCLYSCQRGELQRQAMCRTHGCTHARFTHDALSVIVASPVDHAIRYLSLHDNRYLRAFEAHTAEVVALEMSPKEDFFASASLDDTARMWDLRSTDCAGVMRFAAGGGNRPAVAFDPCGLVFAAALCPDGAAPQVKLFDVRAYDKGPFQTFCPEEFGSKPASAAGLKFSNNGEHILFNTTDGQVHLLDAYNGGLVRTFTGHANDRSQPLEACFSPDGEYVLAGGEDGGICRWHVKSGQILPTLRDHSGPVTALRCNPTRMMVASACTAVCLWLPKA